MNTYYVINVNQTAAIQVALDQKQGTGFFDFKLHDKTVELTTIPTSNTDQTLIPLARKVWVLETDFDELDVLIRGAAEQLSEFFSTDPIVVRSYLSTI